MKRILPVGAFLLVIILHACKKDGLAHYIEYDKSYKKWQVFKDSSHNNYSYIVTTSSWVGSNTETEVTVREGQVVERNFIQTFSTHTGSGWKIDTVQTWNETGAQLGTHEFVIALGTLDDIYHEARTNWLKKRDDAETYFEARNNGMISNCGYVPHGCADDCFRGIKIKEIKAL